MALIDNIGLSDHVEAGSAIFKSGRVKRIGEGTYSYEVGDDRPFEKISPVCFLKYCVQEEVE